MTLIFIILLLQNSKHIIETVYTTLALIAIEIKSGLVATMILSLLLNVQEYLLSLDFHSDISLENRYRWHAVVISLITLICWIHKAEQLYGYVLHVLYYRADNAPFLNPPFKKKYDFAAHHILWNETNLFFDYWEIRYGVWKSFRQYQNLNASNANHVKNKTFKTKFSFIKTVTEFINIFKTSSIYNSVSTESYITS